MASHVTQNKYSSPNNYSQSPKLGSDTTFFLAASTVAVVASMLCLELIRPVSSSGLFSLPVLSAWKLLHQIFAGFLPHLFHLIQMSPSQYGLL